jgi:large subunit ribosomal protein L47
MARIKAIMNERRVAYEGAVELAEKEREGAEDAKVLKFQVDQFTTEKHRQHAEQLRQKLIVKPARTQRAGVKVRERRDKAAESTPPPRAKQPEAAAQTTKKPRWSKAQKLANAEHKKRQAEGKPKNPPSIRRRLHVV